MGESIEIRRRRLIHRSRYTGMKETDLLLGAFAVQYVPGFDRDELDQYERLLNENDNDVFDWASGRIAPPDEIKSSVLNMLIKFNISR